MIKKSFVLTGCLVLFSVLFLSSSVSAYGDLGYFLDKAAYQVQPVAQFFLGGFDYTGYMLFERFLFFLIIFGITFVVLKTQPLFKEQKNILVVISLVVPLLTVRYISLDWLNTILLTYQVFGIAMLSIIPFIIYFFFLLGIAPLDRGLSAIRKIGWILFGCVYLGLYLTSENVFYGQVYLWTAFAAFLFFLADKSIQHYYLSQVLREQGLKSVKHRKVDLQSYIDKLMAQGAADPKNPNHSEYVDSLREMEKLNKILS